MNFAGRSTLILGIAAAVALGTTGCSGGLLGGGGGGDAGSTSGSGESGPIKLGMVIPVSGSSAPTGEYMKNGAQMAVDEINKDGGVNGR